MGPSLFASNKGGHAMRRVVSENYLPRRFQRIPSPGSFGPIVLLIGDEPTARSAALRVLQYAGYEVRSARLEMRTAAHLGKGTGQTLGPIELVVLDASRQPPLALALLEALRQTDSTIPVIAVAGGDPATREEISRLGAEAVLDSPLDDRHLLSAAERLAPLLRGFNVDLESDGSSFH
jgi:CheY-like chemotaxis protein